jgi:peptidoglycan DL-endopeptidase LytF
LEQKNKSRARAKIAVFFVLAVHGIGLMALLMQGCGQSKEPPLPTETLPSNTPPAFVETTNVPVTPSNPPVVVAPPAVPEPPPAPVVPAGATEYTIVKGDILENIAKNNHLSVKAITDANPGIEPKKLKIGQKIHISAPAALAAPAAAGAAPVESATVRGEHTYTVKSGDNLTKIAKQFGTTAKAISAANSLKTTSIKVGQKLKIPTKSSTPATGSTVPVEPIPTSPTVPSPTASPGQ